MSDILFDTVGRAGLITLNRPTALNSLTEAMVREMGDALEEWARDDRVERVAIRSEGKGFCAGGDVRDVYTRRNEALSFFHAEYVNNHRVKHFPKPYVALIDGVCMGGGVGVSVHGSHRIAPETIVFAMPEVGIGLFPDVGASHVLARMEGERGRYLALTGTRLGRDEAASVGIVTHPTRAERLADALDRTAHARDLDRALGEITEPAEPTESGDADAVAVIDDAFSAGSVPAILERLDVLAADSAVAADAAAAIRTKSPTSLMVTNRQIDRAARQSFDECLRTDYRIVSRILEGHDLYEGIRAVVIDKDNAPRWQPATLEGVDMEAVEAHFAEPEHGDLVLPGRQ